MNTKIYHNEEKGTYVYFIHNRLGLWEEVSLRVAQMPSSSVTEVVPPEVTRKNLGTILGTSLQQGLVEDAQAIDKTKENFCKYAELIESSRGKRRELLRQRSTEVVDWIYQATCAVRGFKP